MEDKGCRLSAPCQIDDFRLRQLPIERDRYADTADDRMVCDHPFVTVGTDDDDVTFAQPHRKQLRAQCFDISQQTAVERAYTSPFGTLRNR